MFRELKLARWVLLLILVFAVRPVHADEPPGLSRREDRRDKPGGSSATVRPVVVAGDLLDEGLIQLSSWLAAGVNPQTVLLLDSAFAAKPNQAFLAAYRPGEVLGVGFKTDARAELEERLGRTLDRMLAWKPAESAELRRKLFPRPERVVVCPAEPRRLLLHGAWLAGLVRAPLFIARGKGGDADELRRWMGDDTVAELVGIGSARPMCRALLASSQNPNSVEPQARSAVRLQELIDEAAVSRACRERLRKSGPIQTLVVCNPSDSAQGLGRMSLLAPWLAIQKRAELLLTNDKGADTAEVVREALARKDSRRAESLLLLAGLKAIPTERRPNPIQGGKDAEIEMEPLTPKGNEPFTLATGRLFHQDLAMVLLQLARPLLLPADGKPRNALVVSNPGGGLPLLETLSRHTVNELRNGGYRTTALFGTEADKAKVRKLVPTEDIFLWEGHYRTLIDDYGFLTWTEPLPPALYFLQSCLALKEEEASPLFQRGAMGVIGSSTRTYSGTGGAFTVAFFDAMAYDNQSLGGALRQAKNFLVCYSQLKEKRLGEKAKLTGVNMRSAWAFTLWGDPTLRLPRPQHPDPEKALSAVKHEVRGNTIVLRLPEQKYGKVQVGKYEGNVLPNCRLAGLLTASAEEENNKTLVPFLFAEVHLPRAPAGKKPKLTSKLTERSYVFNWDERRQTGYLLVTPRSKDQTEVRFKVEWVSE